MDDDEYLVDIDDYVANSARFYSFQALEHDIGSASDSEPLTMRVAGMEDAKERLYKSIVLPVRAPHHYTHGGGKLTFDRTMIIYGAKSSGKRFLVRTFCAMHRFNLIEVSHIGFEPVNDLPKIYEKAAASEPCVVLFDDCNGFFRPNTPDARVIAQLNTQLTSMVERYKQVWSIFISVEKPDTNNLHHVLRTAIDQSVWAGSRQINDMLNEQERLDVIVEALSHYLYEENPFTPQQLRQLVIASRNCTAGNIFSYVERVWRVKADSLDAQRFITLEHNSRELIPEWDVFVNQMTRPGGGRSWITDYDPYVYNIQPYGTAPPQFSRDFESAWDEQS